MPATYPCLFREPLQTNCVIIFSQKYVLLASRPQKLFRHSFIAAYEVYDIRSGTRTRLQPSPNILKKLLPPNFGDGGPPGPPPEFFNGRPGSPPPPLPLLYATWSPKGSSLVYVFSNNVFYRASPTSDDVPLSTSGEISLHFLIAQAEWEIQDLFGFPFMFSLYSSA